MAIEMPSPASSTGPEGRSELDTFFEFAVWMFGSREDAGRRCDEVVAAAPEGPLMHWVAAMIRSLALVEPRGRGRSDPLAGLADLLRLDRTTPVTLTHPLVAGDGHRLHVLQWELKRACLAGAVRALWPTRRALFVLLHVLALPAPWVAAVFETTVASIRITNTRTLRTLAGYLQGRCQHIDPSNPCSCEARLGVALAAAFVAWPEHDEAPATAHFDAAPHDLGDLYRSLPRFRRHDLRPA